MKTSAEKLEFLYVSIENSKKNQEFDFVNKNEFEVPPVFLAGQKRLQRHLRNFVKASIITKTLPGQQML